MKKHYFFALCLIAFVLESCSWGVQTRTVGTYVPHAMNVFGTQTTVVLSQANFRVLRNVEVVVEINNTNLRKTDVEKSAFAALTRQYPLSGSQAYINVVTEEISRDEYIIANPPILNEKKQYIAIRATIIEFIKDGENLLSLDTTTANVKVENTSNTELYTTVEEIDNLLQLAQLKVNKYYIAYLFKTKQLNKDKTLLECFNWAEIDKLCRELSVKELEKKSLNHDKEFEKYVIL